ncbi:MAG: ATP-binding protein [Candidatus Njordarchaeales archaeon]
MKALTEQAAGRYVFPFTAFVDQEELKLALILLAINPRIGGLLIMGEKGTGKSALVRALADLLPPIKVVKGCPFNDDPDDPVNMCDICREKLMKEEKLEYEYRPMQVVTLPLSASIDAVVGSIDIEKILREGLKAFQPGILARANRQILYIDEVNLLPDHIVDAILDAAALGWNYVEREGVSVTHPARFILVGTMNPEEGELRPQLLDRFPLSVKVSSVTDEKLRVEIIKRNMEFIEDPIGFRKKWEAKQEELRERIKKAKEILPKVKIDERLLYAIAELCTSLRVDGHRPDIIIALTAKTIAAYQGREYVTEDDVLMAAKLALGHRTRDKGLLEPASYIEIEETFKKAIKKIEKFFRGTG